MPISVIGLAGKKNAGKSSIARQLAQKFSCQIIPFALPIKTMLQAGFNLTEDAVTNPELKKTPVYWLNDKTTRQMMQSLGDWGRSQIGPNCWVDVWKMQARSYECLIVVDDVRYFNEVEAIREMGGLVFWVHSDTAEGGDPHSSENTLDPGYCDYEVTNVNILDCAKNIMAITTQSMATTDIL